MSFPLDLIFDDSSLEKFNAVVEVLRDQNALPRDSFVNHVPFFNFSTISKEAQITELFHEIYDVNQSKTLLRNVVSLSDDAEPETLSRRLATLRVMNFAQIVLYKILPCPDIECPRFPREIATHNQYKDFEYECPFYHHERDRRRLVITSNLNEEFTYKANYYEEGKRSGEKDKYSQNYFESMFHPLYYKMFKCKRNYCSASQFCPFFHNEEEKKSWNQHFSSFVKKDRVSYVKDKQKFYESNFDGQMNSSSGEDQNRGTQNDKSRQKQNKNRKQNYQQQTKQIIFESKPENLKPSAGRKLEELRKENEMWDTNSKSSIVKVFGKSKDFVTQEVC
jgi:hypothetical protein